ncbi:MAG: hypothetical protein ACXAEN_12350 [Candidatus Thorarchaeota archaeon]|jgi:hypothetical protein
MSKRKRMSREQQKAMFAKQGQYANINPRAKAAYQMLTKKQYSSLRSLMAHHGLQLNVRDFDRLIKHFRSDWATKTEHGRVGRGVWLADFNRRLRGAGWKHVGSGVSRHVIADPKSGLAIKFNKPMNRYRATGGRTLRREGRQTITEARRLRELQSKTFKVKTRTGTYRLKVPKLYAVGPTGRYSIVQLIKGEEWRPHRKVLRHTSKKMKLGDIHSGNVLRIGKTVYLIDVGVGTEKAVRGARGSVIGKSGYIRTYRMQSPTGSSKNK